ncbi:MAG TPA: hypothetical protein PKG54_02615 [Phycisphaerae bacterium]|jgi:hypothetical protein|nr:hypothetical protein [Phycisphaerae bacterium]HOB73395.1 hypothetical protein [Phycisphaerae bacterium]HOJ54953.1 hypothetical protein [Phycisphaerae bacterium]HOL25037.1 hypothetical protein [Phycisphaerae bacterium]HPP21338.1 hypothetical protein [Phycisphaerae bacterium]
MSRTYRCLVGSGLLIATLPLLAGSGCPAQQEPCPEENSAAVVNVAGVYRYFGTRPFLLIGTITFEQEGDLVRVTDTTYENSNDRRLMGEAVLQGNRLEIQLVPQNGDTNYRADVLFLFSEDGNEFCVEFSDTNGDAGDLGTYRGTRLSS